MIDKKLPTKDMFKIAFKAIERDSALRRTLLKVFMRANLKTIKKEKHSRRTLAVHLICFSFNDSTPCACQS